MASWRRRSLDQKYTRAEFPGVPKKTPAFWEGDFFGMLAAEVNQKGNPKRQKIEF